MDRELPQTATSDFEAIQASLRTTAQLQEKVQRQLDEMARDSDRRQREYERQRQEEREHWQREYEKRQQEYDRKFGDLSNRWGRFVESLVEGDLVAMLQKQGVDVITIDPHLRGERDGEHFEFDIVAVDGEEVVVVEVKNTLRAEDVKHFLGKLENFTKWIPQYKGSRVYGAVAYLKVVQSAEIYAERKGLFVIRATGNSSSIINRDGFLPKVFD